MGVVLKSTAFWPPWQLSQATAAWMAKSDMRARSWTLKTSSWAWKVRGVWQESQLEPSWPLCGSLWQSTQAAPTRLKTRFLWQLAQESRACEPSRGKPTFSWRKDGRGEMGTHPTEV